MSIRNIFTERIVMPLSDLLTGQAIYKSLKLLNVSQYWSKEQIDNYQNQRLHDLIEHAYRNVPYYYELFQELNLRPGDIQTKEDLRKLPILTKETLRKNISNKKIVAKNISQSDVILGSSSGSTGEPIKYFLTKSAHDYRYASAIRGWYWMGYRLGDRYIKLSMNPRMSLVKKLQDKLNNSSYLYSQQLDRQNFERILNEIIKFKPKFLRCYPVPLYYLSQIIIEKKIEINFIKAINTTGSTLHKNIREYIEEAFNAKIYDSYSCEGGSNVSQCPLGYYHSSDEYAISEFIKDDFTMNDIEGAKRLITTDLHNYSIPFIRYDTQDYLVVEDEANQCDCGRHHQVIKKIKGRDSDILMTPSGKFLIVENFVAYFEWIDSVKQIQIVQTEINKIEINLEVNELYNTQIENDIYNYWAEYIGKDINLQINVVDTIKLTPSGKRRTVIRNPEIKLAL